jgi:hypothetical protein
VAKIDEHLTQWAHNRKFIETIPPEFYDWAVTATLYTAMHAVEALLTADGARDRSSHQDRFRVLQSAQRYDQVYKHYRVLYDLAHVTRYSATPKRWVSADKLQGELIHGLLYPIEKSVRKLLGQLNPPVPMAAHSAVTLRIDAEPAPNRPAAPTEGGKTGESP